MWPPPPPPVTPPQPKPQPPLPRHKVLHLLRHGIALHNRPLPHGNPLPPDRLLDCELAAEGLQQVTQVSESIRRLQPELVIVSPLRRALQTALAIYPDASASPPIVAVEGVREAWGLHLPDKRRPTAVIAQEFGSRVDLSNLPADDICWGPERETMQSVTGRVGSFLRDLLPRTETHVLIVSHGVYLECLLKELLENPRATSGETGRIPHPDVNTRQRIMNCQLNSVVLIEMPMGEGGGGGGMQVLALPIQSSTHALLSDVVSLTAGHYMEDVICWMAELFLRYSQGKYRLGKEPFCQVLTQCGVVSSFVCERYFKALDTEGQGGLSFENFVIGMLAMDPATPNNGTWRRLRAECIFRAYDTDDDGNLSLKEFCRMIEDMSRLQVPPNPLDSKQAEEIARKFHFGRCSQQEFVRAVDSMQLKGTSVLFRTITSPIKPPHAHRQALLERSPSTPRNNPIRPPTTPDSAMAAPVARVASKLVAFDVEARRYSVSPHGKDQERKVKVVTPGIVKESPAVSTATGVALNISQFLLDWDTSNPTTPDVLTILNPLIDLEVLCRAVEEVLVKEPTCLEARAPAKVFGDIHGQVGDLLRIFKAYGRPDRIGDVNVVEYIFNGDFVDRGSNSIEVILLLYSLKVLYPTRVFMIRGNHESRTVNDNFGFSVECRRRLGDRMGQAFWERCNSLFDLLPLAARIEKKILVLHGGIGASLHSLDQLQSLRRPIRDGASTEEPTGQLLRDILWSDPTESDDVTGVRPSERGRGIFVFGPDRVHTFCQANGLDVIIRSHQVAPSGYEFFAGKQLLTVFSATDYCGRDRNDGAILEIDRELVITPKVIKAKTAHWSMPRDSSPPRRGLNRGGP